jgi:hypothetical protein
MNSSAHESVGCSSSTATLDALLKQHRDSDRVRYNVRHNHAPMVLIALYRLGAGDGELERYYQGLHITPPNSDGGSREATLIDAASWQSRLGDTHVTSSYCRFFESEIHRMGREQALRTYLSHLTTGVAAHAFHPLLRLGYGIDVNDDQEIAFGLGYWAATYLPVPDMPADKPSIGPVDLLNILANTSSLRGITPTGNIADRISQFYSHEDFRRSLRPIRFDPEHPLGEISAAIADAFVENHHFSMLHGVTGCHALRMVLPYCEHRQHVINAYWYAVCATYLSVVNVSATKHGSLPHTDAEWSGIQAEAIQTGIEHTIKLAYTCLRESEEYGRDIYRRLALRDIEVPSSFF